MTPRRQAVAMSSGSSGEVIGDWSLQLQRKLNLSQNRRDWRLTFALDKGFYQLSRSNGYISWVNQLCVNVFSFSFLSSFFLNYFFFPWVYKEVCECLPELATPAVGMWGLCRTQVNAEYKNWVTTKKSCEERNGLELVSTRIFLLRGQRCLASWWWACSRDQ